MARARARTAAASGAQHQSGDTDGDHHNGAQWPTYLATSAKYESWPSVTKSPHPAADSCGGCPRRPAAGRARRPRRARPRQAGCPLQRAAAGKHAVVFGGTSGIGLASVLKLAQRGATVVAVSRNPEKAAARIAESGVTLPESVSLRQCDATDAAAVEAFFGASEPVDILISTATGGGRAFGPFLDMDLDGFKGSFAKLWGYATVVRYGAPKLTEHGNIVICSGAPARDAKPGQIALSAVGAAVEAFAKSVAKEIAPKRINVVSPGLIDTPMFAHEGAARDEFFASLTASHLIPRRGTPDEVANAILFVAENGFVTGTTVDVDGGWLLRK